MKCALHIIKFGVVVVALSSCVVTNNLYVNDPVPVEKGEPQVYAGIATGLRPLDDSAAASNKSGNIGYAHTLSLGAQVAVAPKTNIRIALHMPLTFNGAGLKLGIQQSFFKSTSGFNMAIGADIGGALGNIKTAKAYNGDLFMPFSYTFKNESKIVLTPRYSLNAFILDKKMYANLKLLSLGYFFNQSYFEISLFQYGKYFFPRWGYAWFLDEDSGSQNTRR